MKKKVLSLVLATLLIAAMAIPVSATQYNTWGYYNETAYYEIVDNCYIDYFSCMTICNDYMSRCYVKMYTDTQPPEEYFGTQKAGASSTTGYSLGAITRIECKHYVNESMVRSFNMTPF